MKFLVEILRLLDYPMARPSLYGWFHITSLILIVAISLYLCIRHSHDSHDRVRKVVFWVSVLVLVLEVYKFVNYTFSYENGVITADYPWYSFPLQFCSTPMYVGLLFGIFRKGKVHDSLAAYLATYAIFAGVCVMLYPGDIYTETIGINVQTTVCHCSMIILGIYLYATGYVRAQHKTIVKAIPVFAFFVTLAAILNEIAYRVGLLETDVFNMFFISPYCEPSLPVYSQVQAVVPFPFCLIIYIVAFSLAAYIMLLLAMCIRKIACKQDR